MSAPSSIYHSEAVRFTKSGSGSKVHQMALKSAFSSLSDTQLKAKFKLDHLVKCSKSGTDCFVGCVLTGSANAAYHNSSRYGALIENLIMLTDAGINSKASSPAFQTQSGLATIINLLENSISLRATAAASEYEETDIHIKAADSDNLNIYEEELFDTLEASTTEIYTGLEILFDSLYFRVGKTYIFSLRATNAEGDTISSTLSLSPSPAAVNFKYGSTLSTAIEATTAGTVYVNRIISNAIVSDSIIFFADASATTYVATGYYLDLIANESGNYKYFRVTGSAGQVTEINEIVGSRHQEIYYYFSAISAAEAITHAAVEIILYYNVLITPPGGNFENRRYYNGPFSNSTYAAQGYYVKYDRSTVIYIGSNGLASVLIG